MKQHKQWCSVWNMYISGGGTEIRLGGGGAGVRGCEAADYLCEVSACEGEKLGVPYPPALDVYNH